MNATTLYRLYAADGSLLYVGISGDFPQRMVGHEADKHWWSEVDRATFEHFAFRIDAADRERQVIRQERPRWNITHRRMEVVHRATADIIGAAEAARILGKNRNTVTRWVKVGKLTPAVRGDGQTGAMFFYRADVEALVAA